MATGRRWTWSVRWLKRQLSTGFQLGLGRLIGFCSLGFQSKSASFQSIGVSGPGSNWVLAWSLLVNGFKTDDGMKLVLAFCFCFGVRACWVLCLLLMSVWQFETLSWYLAQLAVTCAVSLWLRCKIWEWVNNVKCELVSGDCTGDPKSESEHELNLFF